MSLVIWKSKLSLTNKQEIAVPKGTEFLCVKEQHRDVSIWYRCNPDADKEIRTIIIHGTGHDNVSPKGNYVGTVLLYSGDLVLHVFVQ